MYTKILIPLDFSKVDDKIIDHILGLCSYIKPKVYLLRALHLHTRDALSYEESKTREYLNNIKQKFSDIGIEAEIIIEYGDPDEIIVTIAKKLGCDLLAFATHGHKKIMDFLLGSVVEKVRHQIGIPILLINAGE